MSTLIFNQEVCAFILSDSADISEWPTVIDGSNSFIVGIPFTPTVILDVIVTVPIQYITLVNNKVIQNTEQYKIDTEKANKEKLNGFNNDTQQRLDSFAKTKGYSDIVSACTYATSANLQYKSDADYCVLARDQTWEKLYLIFAEIEQGIRPMPTDYSQIAVDLPVLAWPNI